MLTVGNKKKTNRPPYLVQAKQKETSKPEDKLSFFRLREKGLPRKKKSKQKKQPLHHEDCFVCPRVGAAPGRLGPHATTAAHAQLGVLLLRHLQGPNRLRPVHPGVGVLLRAGHLPRQRADRLARHAAAHFAAHLAAHLRPYSGGSSASSSAGPEAEAEA
jgi:hypothetical protein